MAINPAAVRELFHIWIIKYDGWRPESWADLPPRARVLELAELECFTAAEAAAYIEGHNQAALGRRDCRWAVAVPIVLAFEGDPAPGDLIFPRQMALAPCDA